MPNRFPQDKRLRQRNHVQRRLHPHGNSTLLYRVHHRQRIHHRRQHSHVIRRRPVHLRSLSAAPEISAADHETDLYSHVVDLYNLVDHARDYVLIESESLLARKRFARQFQKYSLILGLHFFPPDFFMYGIQAMPYYFFTIIPYFSQEIYINREKSPSFFEHFCRFFFPLTNYTKI